MQRFASRIEHQKSQNKVTNDLWLALQKVEIDALKPQLAEAVGEVVPPLENDPENSDFTKVNQDPITGTPVIAPYSIMKVDRPYPNPLLEGEGTETSFMAVDTGTEGASVAHSKLRQFSLPFTRNKRRRRPLPEKRQLVLLPGSFFPLPGRQVLALKPTRRRRQALAERKGHLHPHVRLRDSEGSASVIVQLAPGRCPTQACKLRKGAERVLSV